MWLFSKPQSSHYGLGSWSLQVTCTYSLFTSLPFRTFVPSALSPKQAQWVLALQSRFTILGTCLVSPTLFPLFPPCSCLPSKLVGRGHPLRCDHQQCLHTLPNVPWVKKITPGWKTRQNTALMVSGMSLEPPGHGTKLLVSHIQFWRVGQVSRAPWVPHG